MASKKINYLSRDFASIKDELLKFSNMYYPELSDDFNDSSVGAWFIDLVSAVGDDLSYHIDRVYQETDINSANSVNSVLNMARTNGLKIPSRKASMCEVEISCVLPISRQNIAQPDWNYAPIMQSTSIVSAGNYNFQLTEDVNFAEQFNSDGYSNRKIVPSRDGNGNITGYTVSKSTLAINGTTKIYKKVMTSNDIEPFMEIVLPEADVLNIESVIFKETSDYSTVPSIYEYYIDDEEFRVSDDAVMTYRFFETDSLADQWRFGNKVNYSNNYPTLENIYKPHTYDDYTEGSGTTSQRTTRYYCGEWKPLTQKFITEYTDNGYIKLIFGSGNGYEPSPSGMTPYAEHITSKIMNNNMLGVLPKEGWTMFVLYRVGGGSETNLGVGAINTISLANIDWGANTDATDGSQRGKVVTSFTVTNLSNAVGGKDAPSTEEIKYLMKYNTSSQNRAVTVKDYKAKLMQMPPKYGAPFRASVIESNNKIEMSLLGLNADGKLDSALPQTLVENIIEYMSNYKQINDYIEIKSGKIYNIGISLDMFIDKNYNTANVVSSIINKVQEYFDVNARDMGEDIFVGDMEKEITLLDGVISVIGLRIYKIYGGSYSSDKCPLPTYVDGSSCSISTTDTFDVGDSGAAAEKIDLDRCEHVLYNEHDSLFEILNPSSDIQIRVKLR